MRAEFAQHVIYGMAIALLLVALGAVQSFADAAAHDELLAHDAHGGDYRLADERLAGTGDQMLHGGGEAFVLT